MGPSLPNPVEKVPPPEKGHVEDRLMMEDLELALALGHKSVAVPIDAEWLVELSFLAFTNKFLGSPEVGSTPFLDSYCVVLNMNGILLEKRSLLNVRDHIYSFREDIGEFLEFCMRVLRWSSSHATIKGT